MTQPLVVLDTPTLYYRAFYALPDSLRDPAGMPINAARGMTQTLASLVELTGSTRIVAAMDADWRPAFRTAVVPEYKAQRVTDEAAGTETPPDLAVQLPLITALLTAAGIPVAEVPGTEADDVIASIAAGAGEPVVIVSSDRDLLSLLAPGRDLAVMRPKKAGAWVTLRLADLPAAYGVADGVQYRALAALRGDPSDGLAGVPGIGEKTAAALLTGYGDLPGIIAAAAAGERAHGLSPRRAAAILEHRAAVEANHTVMSCREDLPVAGFVAAAGGAVDPIALRELAARHGLTQGVERLLTVLDPATGTGDASGPGSPAAAPGASAPGTDSSGGSWTAAPLWGFDLETTGTDPHTARIVSAALVRFSSGAPVERLTWLVDPGVEIPAASVGIHGITPEHVRAHGRPVAEAVPEILAEVAAIREAGGMLVGHNVVYDLTILQYEAERAAAVPDARTACPPVIDTFVLDKQAQRFRKGARTLTAVSENWGIDLSRAHEALADAEAAVRIALAIAAAHPDIAAHSPAALHAAQIGWKAEQAASFQTYLRSRGRPDAVVDPSWPFEPRRGPASRPGA